jgi:hypothetical protein
MGLEFDYKDGQTPSFHSLFLKINSVFKNYCKNENDQNLHLLYNEK